MRQKPIIGITADAKHDPFDERYHGKISLNWNYAEAVSLAGGSPILLTPFTDMAEILPLLDGWMIPGGLDIPASEYGEDEHEANETMDLKRFAMDQALLRVVPPELPVFGICYGCQFMNVMRGGSLIQHLPDHEGKHEHREGPLQSYKVQEGSKLSDILGSDIVQGKSFHHQGLGKLGKNLAVSAQHEDETIEGIEDPSLPFFVGVQWHPERSLEDPASRKLFEAFVQAASAYGKVKAA